MIKQCNCDHNMQDEMHGKNNRVFTEARKHWDCTACGKRIMKPTSEVTAAPKGGKK